AWIAVCPESAADSDYCVTSASRVLGAYARGDAAEASPMTAALGAQEAARQNGIRAALARAGGLVHAAYAARHDGRDARRPNLVAEEEFAILRVGEVYEESFQDLGVEYYEYVRKAASAE